MDWILSHFGMKVSARGMNVDWRRGQKPSDESLIDLFYLEEQKVEGIWVTGDRRLSTVGEYCRPSMFCVCLCFERFLSGSIERCLLFRSGSVLWEHVEW